jgi:dolichol kinase
VRSTVTPQYVGDVEIVAVLATGAGLVALFALTEALRRHGVQADITRRLAHMSSGGAAATFPLYLQLRDALLLALGFALLLAWTTHEGTLESIHGVSRPTIGGIAFPLGLALAAVVSWSHPYAFAFAVLVLALADPAAGMTGEWLGTNRWTWPGGKTWVGSLGFLLVTLGLAIAFGFAVGEPRPILALVASVVMSTIEAPLIWGMDNLAIPVAAGLLGTSLLGL